MRYCLACLVLLSSFLNCQYVQASEVLAVGTEFAYVFEQTPDGKFVGLGADIVRALAKQNGDTVRFEIYPWSRAQWMVENDQAQILIGPYKTPQREANLVLRAEDSIVTIWCFTHAKTMLCIGTAIMRR